MAPQSLTPLAAVLVGVVGLSLGAACSSGSDPTPATASSASPALSGTPAPMKPGAAAHRQTPRSGAARVDASSLPVPEDFEIEFREQITSSNYLDALSSAAAEASAAKRTHP